MEINVTSNLPRFAEQMRRSGPRARLFLRKGITDATAYMFDQSRQRLTQMVYVPPIPTVTTKRRRIKSGKRAGKYQRRSGSRPAWKRTSTLLRGERFQLKTNGDEIEGIIYNQTPYAQARHDLNRPSRIDGKVRRAPWRTATMVEAGPRVRAIVEQAIQAGLETR